MFYKIRLGVFTFNYGIDFILDTFLIESIKGGIMELKFDMHRGMVQFNNGMRYSFWNSNKYYAWLSDGVITDPNHETIYSYHRERPSAKTMFKFKKLLESYNKEKIKVKSADVKTIYKIIKDNAITQYNGSI